MFQYVSIHIWIFACRRRPVREEYDFFNSKPQQHRRGPTKETDLDRGREFQNETEQVSISKICF